MDPAPANKMSTRLIRTQSHDWKDEERTFLN